MKELAIIIVFLLALTACEEQVQPQAELEPPVRGLITAEVKSAEKTTLRRFPGVLEPGEITNLSFDVTGKLGKIDLTVGQTVEKDQFLAEIESKQFQTAIENREAAVREASAQLDQDKDNLERKEKLLERGVATRVSVDEARTAFRVSEAQFVQARKDLQSAREDLEDTILTAPYGGVINSIDVDSFATVGAGTTVVSLYSASSYEVSFSVSFDTISKLVVGTPAFVRLADDPSTILTAVVSELGDRADTVSSFPVVIRLTEDNSVIKSGMAVEVSFEFKLPAEKGYLIPISAAILEGQIPDNSGPNTVTPIGMFVFDPDTATVKRRTVQMGGIRENKFLIIDGLEEGDHVAIAGVSFLRDGMKVKLLRSEK